MPQPSSTQPNIIFILIDDLGWADLGCFGSSFYETPNLDRLRAEGMMFTDGYATCPVCSPTRISVQTGRYPARVGVTNYIAGSARGRVIEPDYVKHLPREEYTVAQALRDAGYATWNVGKWHMGEEDYWPEHFGYEVNIGGCAMGAPSHGYFSPWQIPTLPDGPEGEYLTDRLTDEAIRLIQNSDGRPFFLHLAHYAVHTPLQAKPEHIARFEAKAAELGLDEIDPFEVGEPFPMEHKRDQRVTRRTVQSDPRYAAMIWSLDEAIGRLLAAVEEAGQAGNTVVVFTSDNGGLATSEGSPTCNAPLSEGKGWMYEGGVRESLLITWPGVTEPGSTCDVPVTTTDFYPTFLEIAGADPMPVRADDEVQPCDGVSLAPLLRGESALDREAIFWHYPHYGNQGGTPGSSVRAGDHKLIELFADGRLELYHLRADIGEEHDLSAEEPDRAEHLHAMLRGWREEIGAQLPTPNPDWAEQ